MHLFLFRVQCIAFSVLVSIFFFFVVGYEFFRLFGSWKVFISPSTWQIVLMGKVVYVGNCGISEIGEHSSNLFQFSEISYYSDGLYFIKKLCFFSLSLQHSFLFFCIDSVLLWYSMGEFLFWPYLIGVLCVPCLGLSLVMKALFYDHVKDLNSAETGVLPYPYL